MYWFYNVCLVAYWFFQVPVLLYRLVFEDGFYDRLKAECRDYADADFGTDCLS